VVGIATDYCVRATAADAAANGFGTRVLLGLTAGVDPTSTAEAVARLRGTGVQITRALPPAGQRRESAHWRILSIRALTCSAEACGSAGPPHAARSSL